MTTSSCPDTPATRRTRASTISRSTGPSSSTTPTPPLLPTGSPPAPASTPLQDTPPRPATTTPTSISPPPTPAITSTLSPAPSEPTPGTDTKPPTRQTDQNTDSFSPRPRQAVAAARIGAGRCRATSGSTWRTWRAGQQSPCWQRPPTHRRRTPIQHDRVCVAIRLPPAGEQEGDIRADSDAIPVRHPNGGGTHAPHLAGFHHCRRKRDCGERPEVASRAVSAPLKTVTFDHRGKKIGFPRPAVRCAGVFRSWQLLVQLPMNLRATGTRSVWPISDCSFRRGP